MDDQRFSPSGPGGDAGLALALRRKEEECASLRADLRRLREAAQRMRDRYAALSAGGEAPPEPPEPAPGGAEEELRVRVEELGEQLRRKGEESRTLREQIEALRSQAEADRRTGEKGKVERERAREREESLQTELARLRGDQGRLAELNARHGQEAAARQAECERLREALAAREGELAQARSALALAREERARLIAEHKRRAEIHAAHERELVLSRTELQRARTRIEESERITTELRGALAAAERNADEAARGRDEALRDLEAHRLSGLSDSAERSRSEELSRARAEIERLEMRLADAETELMARAESSDQEREQMESLVEILRRERNQAVEQSRRAAEDLAAARERAELADRQTRELSLRLQAESERRQVLERQVPEGGGGGAAPAETPAPGVPEAADAGSWRQRWMDLDALHAAQRLELDRARAAIVNLQRQLAAAIVETGRKAGEAAYAAEALRDAQAALARQNPSAGDPGKPDGSSGTGS